MRVAKGLVRAVWGFLAGAVLAVGGAEAKGCPADAAVFKARIGGPNPPETKRFSGATFHVIKAASKFTHAYNPANGSNTTPGELHLLIRGTHGSFLVTSYYAPGSLPAYGAFSAPASEPPPVTWGQRNQAMEHKFRLADGDLTVMGGPLAGYELQNMSCR
jgi:hypothetical protein